MFSESLANDAKSLGGKDHQALEVKTPEPKAAAPKKEIAKQEVVAPNGKCVAMHNEGGYKSQLATKAYQISGCDKVFVAMLQNENGAWTIDRLSTSKYYRNGRAWSDQGFCQISRYYHTATTTDPRFLTDADWQMQKCYELYKGGTTFYGIHSKDKQGFIYLDKNKVRRGTSFFTFK